jgi:hypothetical protein
LKVETNTFFTGCSATPASPGSHSQQHCKFKVITFKQYLALKVPKREILDRSYFPDFYTIKSLRVGVFGVKIKKFVKIFRGLFRGAKFLTRMLSLFLRSFFSKLGSTFFFFLWCL